MSETLTLHLSGPFRATLGSTALTGLSRRAQALLAYLACQPAMRAERALLADLLWSDRASDQARASLRQELSVLRKHLPNDLLNADRQMVWLDTNQVAIETGPEQFLQGFDLPSEPFEDWLRLERNCETDTAPIKSQAEETLPVVAVLPFDELGTAQDDMFADGVVEEITAALSRAHTFHVIARQSAFALRNQPLDIPTIAERLGADYVVEGSIRRSGERVRISVQLVRGSDGHTLWAERFDDRIDDLFDLQDRIAANVAGQMSPNLRMAEIARIRDLPAAHRSAYGLTLSALPHFWAHRAEENARAIALFDAAIAQSPDYGPALAYKAWAHALQCCYFWSTTPDQDRQDAIAAADKALPLVQDDPASLTALAGAVSLANNEFEQAQNLIDRALTLDPNNAWAWLRQGWNAIYLNDLDTALAAFDRAEHLSPLDPFLFNVHFGRSAAYRTLRRFDEAIALVHKGLRAGPGVTWAYRMLFGTYMLMGDTEKAREALASWREANPTITADVIRNFLPKWVHDPKYYEILLNMPGLDVDD